MNRYMCATHGHRERDGQRGLEKGALSKKGEESDLNIEEQVGMREGGETELLSFWNAPNAPSCKSFIMHL